MTDQLIQGRLDLLTRQVNVLTNRLNALTNDPPMAFVRLWNAPGFGGGGDIVISGGTPAPVTAPVGQYDGGYIPFTPGFPTLTLTAGSATPLPFPTPLEAGKYYTFVMHLDAATGYIGVRSAHDYQEVGADPALPNLLRVIHMASGYTARTEVPGGLYTLGPLLELGSEEDMSLGAEPVGGFDLSYFGTDPDGTEHTWNGVTSFAASGSAMNTVLMILDGYGRFRPRVFADGPPA